MGAHCYIAEEKDNDTVSNRRWEQEEKDLVDG